MESPREPGELWGVLGVLGSLKDPGKLKEPREPVLCPRPPVPQLAAPPWDPPPAHPPVPASRSRLPAESGPGWTERRGDMPGGFDAQVGLGPAACSGLPSCAGSLPRSLPCEAPAPCVFRILGNGQGAPARAASPAHTTPTEGGVERDTLRPPP